MKLTRRVTKHRLLPLGHLTTLQRTPARGDTARKTIMKQPIDHANHLDISRIVAEARQQRSDALGELIAVGGRKLLRTLGRKADQFLHLMLMSPTTRRIAR